MLCGRQVVLVAAAFQVACGVIYAPSPDWETSPEAARIVRESLTQSQGFDALEAWELNGLQQGYRFAFARKWHGDRVKILGYALAPAELEDAAYLGHFRPGEPPEVWIRVPDLDGPYYGQIRRGRGSRAPPAVVIAAEVALPTLPDDYAYRRLEDDAIEGEPCSVVEGRVLHERGSGGFDRLVYCISQLSGVALRKVYYRGDRELRRVSVSPRDVQETDGRALATRYLVRIEDGTVAELRLRNALLDVELPDSLFTERTLETRRYPSF